MDETLRQRKLGDVIRYHRERLGWSQTELADRIGGNMSQSDVSKLELGRITLPHRPRMEAIADAIGVPLGELLAASGWEAAPLHVEAASECIQFPVPPASRRGQILADVAALTDEQLEIIWSVVDGIKRSKYGEERNGGPEPAHRSTALGA